MYGLRFSHKVVTAFHEAHPRGWAFFKENYPEFNYQAIVQLFAKNQPGWNITKLCIKLAERLITVQMSSSDIEFIKMNVSHLRFREVDKHQRTLFTLKAKKDGKPCSLPSVTSSLVEHILNESSKSN